MLVGMGARQLTHDTHGRHPLGNAASQGHHAIEDYLFQVLRKLPDRNTFSNIMTDFYWMLKYAAKKGDEDRERYLLSQGADINFQLPVDSFTPLCDALKSAPCPLSMAQLLLEEGADPNAKASPHRYESCGRRGPSIFPFTLALRREESYCLIKLLLQHGADARKSGYALFTALRLRKAAEFRLLVENGANISATYQRTSIAWLVFDSEYQPIMDVLLEHGVTPDAVKPPRGVGL